MSFNAVKANQITALAILKKKAETRNKIYATIMEVAESGRSELEWHDSISDEDYDDLRCKGFTVEYHKISPSDKYYSISW